MANVGIQLGQIIMSAAVTVAAMTAATLGFGLPAALAIGGMITALGVAASAQSYAAISAQQYPPPPVAALAAFADGGIADRPAIFGERGRELAIPMYDNPGKDFGALKDAIARELVSGAQAGNTYDLSGMTINVMQPVDGPALVDYVSRELVKEMEAARG